MIAGPIILVLLFGMFILEARREARTKEWKQFLLAEWVYENVAPHLRLAYIKHREAMTRFAGEMNKLVDTLVELSRKVAQLGVSINE